MTSFDKRERAFESKFAHDQNRQFIIEARRNKIIGLWAADLMGLTGEDADSYAKEIQLSDLEEPGHNDVIKKLSDDFRLKGVTIGLQELNEQLQSALELARKQVYDEEKHSS